MTKPHPPAKFRVYDQVWVMLGDKPAKLLVFAVVESMDYWKQSTEIQYHLVMHRVGSGWGNNEGERFDEDKCFASRAELLASL